MSVADKITRLSNARDDIIDALGEKDVTATGHGFEDFADDIRSIQSGGSVIISDTIDSHGGTIREITTTGDVVMLQEKTVTPSTSQQVITADSETSVVDTVVCTVATRDASVSTSHTWLMTSGESYHVSGSGTINSNPITVSDDITWTGSSISVAYTGGQGAYSQVTGITLTSTGVTITYSASGDNYGSLTLEIGETISSYDGLSQVTVNPIPSEYIIPSGTSQITENGSYDITPYSTVNVAVSGGGSGDEIDGLIMRTISGTYTNNTVTSIGPYAFTDCSTLTLASFPLCTSIGDAAFYRCVSLQSISFPLCTYISSSAFDACSSLTLASFPKCTSIGSSAFQRCGSLTSISFPVCASINDNAFAYCSSLTLASFPECTHLGTYAFYSCKSLTAALFPKCTAISSYTFHQCSTLSSMSFPLCTTIGDYAFQKNIALTSALFPVCTSISAGAFISCYSLTSISFPVCSYIGYRAFYDCRSLTLISFPSCTFISNSAFHFCQALTSISLPVCSAVSSYAFHTCIALTMASLPVCSYVGTYAFCNCSNLQSFNAPVYSIMNSAFINATNLSLVVLSYSGSLIMNSIYRSAFYKNTRLLSLYLINSPAIYRLADVDAFTSTPIAGYTVATDGVYGSIFVPASLYDSYITATNWATFSSRFVSLTDAEIEALPF